MRFLAAVALVSLPALGGELVYLRTGQTLEADRTEREGTRIILHRNGGTIAMPATEVTRVEVEERAATPAPPPPAPTAPPAAAEPKLTPKEMVARAAEKYGLPPALLDAVARMESGYRVDAISPKGAIGLMQLMPTTAAELKADPRDPAQNAEAGARYLRDLLERFGYSAHRALAAYNAGPAAVDKYNGIPPYSETRTYVDRVLGEYLKSQKK